MRCCRGMAPSFEDALTHMILKASLLHFYRKALFPPSCNGALRSHENLMFVPKRRKGLRPQLRDRLPWLLSSGPRFNPRCCHVRWKFHPGHKCHSPHYHGPHLTISHYLSESDVKLSHPFIHPCLEVKDRNCCIFL